MSLSPSVECHDGGIVSYPIQSQPSNPRDRSDWEDSDGSCSEPHMMMPPDGGRSVELSNSSRHRSARVSQSPSADGGPTERMRRERRRKQLGFPTLRPDHVGILSHTIFIGHLHKQLAESRLHMLCAEIANGPVLECNLIPPRGCAFVTFATRRAACRAVVEMDQSTMNGRQIKVAWAPNRGVQNHPAYLRNYWNADEGCTYIPFGELLKLAHPPKLEELLNGHGEVDVDSITDERVRDLMFSSCITSAQTTVILSPTTPTSSSRHASSVMPYPAPLLATTAGIYAPPSAHLSLPASRSMAMHAPVLIPVGSSKSSL